ncbi:PRAME family member 20-like [Erinaceus europaeus]|uniref:PRAME family member 20-like n=1 Tax=Erinaceus europaeus TaxID=9365 RepID=A0ABM3YBC3_ERIEU|nr:PRAME family member 20-like [Erinaceus europaeus]
MNYNNPSSLLQLTIQSLLKDDNLAISSLKDIPDALLPSLFLEAHIQGCYKTLKAIVLIWPFERLPLGSLVHDRAPENPSFKAVMDGIDVLIKQKVSPRKYSRFLYAVSCCDIKEVGIHCTLPFSTLGMLANLLGMLSNLKRLVVCIKIPTATTPEKRRWRLLSINNFTSECSQLLHLQELYLESPSFLKDHLHCQFRCFNTSLEVFSLTNCRFRKKNIDSCVLMPMYQSTKGPVSEGSPLTSVSKCLPSLLEVNAATLQHLDLGLCGLQDPQLEALLPALSSCSQLSSLSLHGNRLSVHGHPGKAAKLYLGHQQVKTRALSSPSGEFQPTGSFAACNI